MVVCLLIEYVKRLYCHPGGSDDYDGVVFWYVLRTASLATKALFLLIQVKTVDDEEVKASF